MWLACFLYVDTVHKLEPVWRGYKQNKRTKRFWERLNRKVSHGINNM